MLSGSTVIDHVLGLGSLGSAVMCNLWTDGLVWIMVCEHVCPSETTVVWGTRCGWWAPLMVVTEVTECD